MGQGLCRAAAAAHGLHTLALCSACCNASLKCCTCSKVASLRVLLLSGGNTSSVVYSNGSVRIKCISPLCYKGNKGPSGCLVGQKRIKNEREGQ